MIQALIFYFFAAVLVGSAMMVVTARNPVHAVLFLIFGFFNAAGLMLMLGAEFVAMILVIVYVGAVAVLFLFVVMMLDVDFSKLRSGATQYIWAGSAAGAILLAELVLIMHAGPVAGQDTVRIVETGSSVTNTEALGRVIYTDYVFAFQVAGLILLVAMIGAIVLTLRSRPGVRRQKVEEQTSRKVEDVLEIRKISSGTGV